MSFEKVRKRPNQVDSKVRIKERQITIGEKWLEENNPQNLKFVTFFYDSNRKEYAFKLTDASPDSYRLVVPTRGNDEDDRDGIVRIGKSLSKDLSDVYPIPSEFVPKLDTTDNVWVLPKEKEK